jgi:hypothetical protein
MANELQSAFASADTLAAQRIQSVQLVHQARNARLTRELAALRAQHAPDDEIKAAEAAVAASAFTASRVAIVHQQMTTPQPEVAAEGWVLHGRVFDHDLKPVSGFTVFLVDAQKMYRKQFGFDYTDETGYYLISHSGPGTPGKAPGSGRSSSSEQSSTEGQLFLEVADTNAYPVYLSEAPFQLVTGTAVYQNVTLAPGNKPIGDPPQQIRDIAMPARGKKKSSR